MTEASPIEVRQPAEYAPWFDGLRARIDLRLRRVSLGNLGDVKQLGGGVAELRIDYGPGYRVYLTRRGPALVLLLAGGGKSTQAAVIVKAHEPAARQEAE